jgi:hypothetical protein
VTRPTWPDGVGIALEWETAVDPFGSALPKIGVIFLSPDPSLETARLQVVAQAERASRLLAHGYRANAERTWPLLRRMDTHRNWWEEPESWASDGVERVIEVWNEMAPGLDQVFPEPPLIAAV